MGSQNVREQAEAFLVYAHKRHAWSLSATFQHWSRSEGLSVTSRQAVWREVKRITDTDDE